MLTFTVIYDIIILILERLGFMFYVQNFLILFIILFISYKVCKPKRYKTIRKHSALKRDYKVYYSSSRRMFHQQLMSRHRHLSGIKDNVDLVISKKERNRVVGAFVYMNYDLLQRNKKLIKDGIVKRDSKKRQLNGAPCIDDFRDKVVDNGSGKSSLYHLTHLIAFRHSLSEGDFEGLLFTGTAHLNSGARYNLDYVPPYSKTSDSTLSRVNKLKDMFFANDFKLYLKYPTVDVDRDFGSYGKAQYSLNDFEMLFDFFVNWKKNHVFKYGVECYYKEGSPLVYDVNVIIIDVTDRRLLVDVMLRNKL